MRRAWNWGGCPEKMFELVNAFSAATAPELAVVPGRITEQTGKLASMKAHGSGMMRFFCRDSSPLNDSRSGKVTPGTVTAGAKNWSQERRKRTGHHEFLEWCEWLAIR